VPRACRNLTCSRDRSSAALAKKSSSDSRVAHTAGTHRRERSRDAGTLCHAAGELSRPEIDGVFQTDEGKPQLDEAPQSAIIPTPSL
jgi:hypothetical protein